MGTRMDDRALLTLAQWLSPGYPVGSYAYSHGLEWAVEAGDVADAAALQRWAETCLRHGSGRSDAILLAQAYRSNPALAADIAELGLALQPSAERRLETTAQGAAFARMTAAVWPDAAAAGDAPYPVAVGRAARALGCPPGPTIALYLQAFVANLVSAGVRLVPLGQTDGQRIIAALTPAVAALAEEAWRVPLEAIGGFAIRADMASMRHETQRTRLFRS